MSNITIYGDDLCSEGQKSGDGHGSGYGFGIGVGENFGSGYGFGTGHGDGYGSAFGYGDGLGNGSSIGYTDDVGSGNGDGLGYGLGAGSASFSNLSPFSKDFFGHKVESEITDRTANLPQIALSSFPGKSHEAAIELSLMGVSDPILGVLGVNEMQLCAQNIGYISESLAKHLRLVYPDIKFRLHSNARILPEMCNVDLADFLDNRRWFHQASKISNILGASCYTLHPGLRARASMKNITKWAFELEQIFGCKVGIEGLYETHGNKYLVSDWSEYRQLFESGVNFALDFSHVNIVACRSGVYEKNLLLEMLDSPSCVELHLSSNDGMGDTHQILMEKPWWFNLLNKVREWTTVFYEGNLLRNMRAGVYF